MTGRLQMKQSELMGIPTPLDSDKDHAANVDYVLRKKRSLEVVVGGEEEDNNNNNGGGTGGGSGGSGGGESGGGSGEGSGGGGGGSAGGPNWDESYYEDGLGHVVFRLSRRNVDVGGVKFQDSILWAEWNYEPTFEEMNYVMRLKKATAGERYKMAEILVRGRLSYDFTFKIDEGKARLYVFDNSSYITQRNITFSSTMRVEGAPSINGRKSSPSTINIMNLTSYEENKPLYGTWDWNLTLTVNRGDLGDDWPGFARIRS